MVVGGTLTCQMRTAGGGKAWIGWAEEKRGRREKRGREREKKLVHLRTRLGEGGLGEGPPWLPLILVVYYIHY